LLSRSRTAFALMIVGDDAQTDIIAIGIEPNHFG
jgi:hypothetical protein